MTKTEFLNSLLDRLEQAPDSPQLEQEAADFLANLSDAELERMEAELAASGSSPERLRLLCNVHQKTRANDREGFRASLADDHPIATMMDEHTHILSKLSTLEETLQQTGESRPAKPELTTLSETGEFLISVEPHHAREEQVLFPLLRERGVNGPPQVMELEHQELRQLKHQLRDGAKQLLDKGEGDWQEIRNGAFQLVQKLRDHIFKEDHILYPMAIKVVTDASVWHDAKTSCDAIGYCCQRPPDA